MPPASSQRPKASPINPRSLPFDLADFRANLHAWFARVGRDLPWRRTRDPYAIWISEAMLQQTQVATVLPYYERWLNRFPNVNTLASAAEPDVLRQWEGLGYYSRARNLHRAAKIIVAEHGGKIPSDPAVLGQLPGIGRYTAGAIAAFGFDLPVPVVDTNIARVLTRLFEITAPLQERETQIQVWERAAQLVRGTDARLHTSALMELGALLCTAKKPQCLLCPVKRHCAARTPELLPKQRDRPQITRLTEAHAICKKGDRFRLSQSDGARWKRMWLFPEHPTPVGDPDWVINYTVTRFRIRLEAFLVLDTDGSGDWFTAEELSYLPMPSPHRRLSRLVCIS